MTGQALNLNITNAILCHFVFLTLKGMRIHRRTCAKKSWWKQKMVMMTSRDKVPTCDDISKEHALFVGQSAANSNHPTMFNSMSTPSKDDSTCEDISSESINPRYPTIPKLHYTSEDIVSESTNSSYPAIPKLHHTCEDIVSESTTPYNPTIPKWMMTSCQATSIGEDMSMNQIQGANQPSYPIWPNTKPNKLMPPH